MTTGPEVVIDRVTLIVSDLDRAEDDYVKTFGCSVEQRSDIDPSLIRVLCIRRGRGRRSLLRLGRERIELLEFTDSAGRPYPPDSTSTDLWFQHMAIVVTDIGHAYQRVMANRRFRPISRNGPVRLPDNSGGVTAFKFRDHDGHPLELLAFPDGRVPGEWRSVNGTGSFLGVDHTAIGVSDSARSARFFGSVFGFRAGTRTENRGPEQDDLDDVDDVHVSVTRLAPDLPAPRLELLHYHLGTRRPIPHDIVSNDIVATHCVVRVASLDATAAALARRGTPLAKDDLMLLHGGIRAGLVSGPDGHRFLVEERAAAVTGARPGLAQAHDQLRPRPRGRLDRRRRSGLPAAQGAKRRGAHRPGRAQPGSWIGGRTTTTSASSGSGSLPTGTPPGSARTCASAQNVSHPPRATQSEGGSATPTRGRLALALKRSGHRAD